MDVVIASQVFDVCILLFLFVFVQSLFLLPPLPLFLLLEFFLLFTATTGSLDDHLFTLFLVLQKFSGEFFVFLVPFAHFNRLLLWHSKLWLLCHTDFYWLGVGSAVCRWELV